MDLFWSFGTMTATAHAQVDRDGYTYNIGTSYVCGTKYAIVRFDPETKPGTSIVLWFKYVPRILLEYLKEAYVM